jgi:hypothetical protein
MVSPFALVAWLGVSLGQNARIEQGVSGKAPRHWRHQPINCTVGQLKVDKRFATTFFLVDWEPDGTRLKGGCVGEDMGLARLAALGIVLALAGCVTTAENSLSQNDIANMKLTGVTVSFAPEAGVQWEDGIRAYATA